jgi:hypothetical protein
MDYEEKDVYAMESGDSRLPFATRLMPPWRRHRTMFSSTRYELGADKSSAQ